MCDIADLEKALEKLESLLDIRSSATYLARVAIWRLVVHAIAGRVPFSWRPILLVEVLLCT